MITVRCHRCRKETALPVSEAQITRWHSGELIQRVMPELSADDRELLISGICGSCFDQMFEEDDDDDD